jgi:hypothetical protein
MTWIRAQSFDDALKKMEEKFRKMTHQEVLDSLPPKMAEAVRKRDMKLLQEAFSEMEPLDIRIAMRKCEVSGLVKFNDESSDADKAASAGRIWSGLVSAATSERVRKAAGLTGVVMVAIVAILVALYYPQLRI